MSTFGNLKRDATPAAIYGEAGRIFEARKERNQQIDFNKEIWYLAGDALNYGFYRLRGKTKENVASEMGDFIIRYIRSQRDNKPPGGAPRGKGYGEAF